MPAAGSLSEGPADRKRTAVARLYERTGGIVFRRCFQMLGDPQEALDATQVVYLKAIETTFEVRTDQEALSWLYRTATRLCLQLLRNRRTRTGLLQRHGRDAFDLPPASPEAIVVGHDLLRRALARVDDATAEMALLTFAVGLPVERTAELCGVSPRTVIRARMEFQRIVGALDANEEAS